MILALLVIAGFAVGFVLMLVDIDRLIAESDYLDGLWDDDSHDGGGRASSDRVKATTPAAVPYLVDERKP